ncbi:peptide ABC transporter substrate-binding protein [Oscillochloris sp. ZM17-4]|uniref:peptide ABC transporter substrate-binding protein n=1 Tax=Oscillochloris sp. ZM17-4 TaxID=2866714 RepID=UPI001C72D999|nr:peptide ABC transporter substrate-binding protein [Oscillochloris sp. ZM17-4]MBX0330678.1 peptide ABC transporter substrate-binding protein [Oscillochloris sp. ZM17-4]
MRQPRAWTLAWLLMVASMLIAACGGAPAAQPTAAPAAADATAAPAAADATAAPAEPAAGQTLNGVTLPDDAAPPEYQVYVTYFPNDAPFTTVDQMESIYNQGGFNPIGGLLGEPLLRLNKDFEVQPAAALTWSSNADATEWTFNLDPNMIWSDGTPLTADDFVASFQYAASPDHAWDFAWYYGPPGAIKNWEKVVAGEVPPAELGMKADGPNTLIVSCERPTPYMPAKLAVYSITLQKAALEKLGPLYNNDPATSVSSGPFVLTEWKKGEKLVYEANPNYKGTNKPFIQKVIVIGAKQETMFAGYQAGEADFVSGEALQTADNEIINADPELSKEVRTIANDFRTDYLFFDDQNPPFNDVKVRQAFGHIVDRDAIIQTIVTPSQAIPAYSFLMPGFPAANSEGLKDIQSYDPDKARALLAEAGFPGGAGFPKLTLRLRNESATRQAVAQAIAATIKQELGIEVEVQNDDFKVYMDDLNAKPTKMQFGMVSYGMDWLDPSNMLGVWLGTGRHNWQNAEYDKLVNEAAENTDQAARIAQFQEAEKLLVTDAPGVFIYHRTVGNLMKPYLKGSALEPNSSGLSGLQWPGFHNASTNVSTLYITKDVLKYRSSPPK